MERVDYESILIQDLINSNDRDELNLNPWYQRRAVWTKPQKAYLINTILERKPVPTIYIRHAIDFESERSIKEVVDGQQRIRCILEYRADAFRARHPSQEKPVAYSELPKSSRIELLQTPMSAGYLIGANDQDVIEIFARINSVSKTLNPQEKRNAKFAGAFKQFSIMEAVSRLPFWRANRIFTDNDIARMVEVQFISDLAMNLAEGLQDFSAHRLNKFYEANDEQFALEENIKKRLNRLFNLLLELREGLFIDSIFSKPQVLFSLLLVMDSLPKLPHRKLVEICILDIDTRILSVETGDSPQALAPDVIQAFTTGNTHRIRFRKIRDRVLRTYFTKN